jgi:hypothetical protein
MSGEASHLPRPEASSPLRSGLVSLGVFARAVRESLGAPQGPEPGAKLPEVSR